jgi:hypothetical protein
MKGYLPHQTVKRVVFWIMVACVVTTTAAGILRAWEGIDAEIATRLFQSAGVLAFGSGVFLLLNLLFGDFGRYVFGPGREAPPLPNLDPAFAERLKRAKVSSEEETRSKSG